jgi:hypothetical protein
MNTDTHTASDEDPALATARRHVSLVAHGLVLRFGHERAAATLAGALVGVVTEAYDDATAARWLRDLADGLEGDDETPVTYGHA